MTVLDLPLRAVAKSLVGTFGTPGVIEYTEPGAYDTTTGLVARSTPARATVDGVIEQYSAAEIDGTTVRRGDVKWTIAAKGVDAPSTNDLVTLDGDVRYAIIDVRRIYSGDQAALYQLQLRR